MKKTYHILVCLLTAFSAVSCADFLKVETESAFTGDVVFSDPYLADGAVMGIYEAINYQSFSGRLWAFHGYNTDIERHISSVAGAGDTRGDDHYGAAVYKYNEAYDYYGSAYSYAMIAIERANVCIDGLRRYGNVDKNPALAYLLGEALFLRSWIYYELIGMWGNIPARYEPLNDKNLYAPRADRDIHFKQILADLEEAAALMPWAGGRTETNTVLRPNKAAAKGLRARVALTAGGYGYHLYGEMNTPMLSTDPELTVRKTYTIARDECRELIENEGRGYILENDFAKIFMDNCWPRYNIGSEPLWELPFKFNQRGNWMVAAGVFHRGEGGASAISADKDPWTTVYLGGTMGITPTVYYDYDSKDKRRDISVVAFRWSDGLQELNRPSQMTSGKLRGEWKDPSSPKIAANANDGVAPIIIRYADVLLMFAEAENELNNGPTGEAIDALHRVRQRAFDNPVTPEGGSKEDFFEAIVNERKLEFVGEMIRKHDLKRWNRLKSSMDEAKSDMYELRDLTGKYTDVPAYVFWKPRTNAAGEREIVWFGLNRGEFAPGTEGQRVTDQTALTGWMNLNGWRNWNNKGRHLPDLATPDLWITNSPTSGYFSDEFIEAQYHTNPDRRFEMPLPSSVIMNSQGSLNNAYLGYSN